MSANDDGTDDAPQPPPATRSTIPIAEPGPDEPYYLETPPDPSRELLETVNAPAWVTPLHVGEDGAVMPADQARQRQAELDAAAED